MEVTLLWRTTTPDGVRWRKLAGKMESMSEGGKRYEELADAVKTLIEARTGDAATWLDPTTP